MTNTTTTATIELLGKPYHIKCPEQELPALQKAADYLNRLLQTLANKPLAPEKLGMMAALNLASQLLEREQQVQQRLTHLEEKLESILTATDAVPTFHLEVESA